MRVRIMSAWGKSFGPGRPTLYSGVCSALAVLLLFGAQARGADDKDVLAKCGKDKSGRTCAVLGEAHYFGAFGKPNAVKARKYLDAACKAGDAISCHNYAYLLRLGEGGNVDWVGARNALKTSCYGGRMDACNDLASFLYLGRGGPEDKKKAVEMFQENCTLGSAPACLNFLVRIKGSKKDLKMRDEFVRQLVVQRDCDDWGLVNCVAPTGAAAEALKAIPNSETHFTAEARVALEKACGENIALACLNLGRLHYEGMGGPRDLAKAKDLFDRACAANLPAACESASLAGQLLKR